MNSSKKDEEASLTYQEVCAGFMAQTLAAAEKLGLLHKDFYVEVPLGDNQMIAFGIFPSDRALETLAERRSAMVKCALSLREARETLEALTGKESEHGH